MRRTDWLLSLAVLGLAFWLRVADLWGPPVFVDEGAHLQWARLFVRDDPQYPVWMEGRLLTVLAFALLDVYGPAPLWTARAVVVVVSLLNTAGSLALGRALAGRWGGVAAGLLYALLPYALFHDRQALGDPLSAAFGTLAVCAAIGLARRPRAAGPAVAVLAGAMLGAGLSKFTGALYGVALALAGWRLARPAHRAAVWRRYGLALGLAALATAAIPYVLGDRLGTQRGILLDQDLSLMQCPPALCRGDWAEQARRLPVALLSLFPLITAYFGWPLVALAGLGLWPPRPNARALAAVLGASSLLMLAAVVVAVRAEVVPRYVGFLAVPACALAAAGLHRAFDWLKARWPGWPATAALAGLGLLIARGFANTPALLISPEHARLAPIDERQYFIGAYSGLGFWDLTQTIQAEADPARPPFVVLGTTWHVLPMNAYFDARQFQAYAAVDLTWPAVEAALAAGRPVYVLDELALGVEGDDAPGVVAVVPREGEAHTLRLRRFAPTEPAARAALFTLLFRKPEGFIDHYRQLVAEAAPGEVLAPVPAGQAELLTGRAEVAVLTADPPWDPGAMVAALAALGPEARVRAVFLAPERLDPNREVERWLAEHLYHEGERWYGPVRVAAYAGAPAAGAALAPGARFGDALWLEAAEVLDPVAVPGGLVRLRLVYRAIGPTAAPLKVFVHLFEGERIVSQHDGEPVAGFRPTTALAVGEVVVDRLALRLPADLPPGAYNLRVGVYAADTQERLPTLLANGQSADYVLLSTITIK